MNLGKAIISFVLSFAFLVFFMYAIFGTQWIFQNCFAGQRETSSLADVSGAVQNIVSPTPTDPPPALKINAESAISVESNLLSADKIIFEKSGSEKLPIASLTKLMTAVVAIDNYNLSDEISVDAAADAQDSLKQDVKLGDTMPAESFLEIMLVESSNKSAYTLAEKMGEQKFSALMNQKAKNIGLQNTFFADPTGLSSQNVSTAQDLAKLAEYILKNYPKIGQISRLKEINVPNFGEVENSDELLGEVSEIVCSKTGFTDVAKGCLLLVINNTKNSDYIINIILGADDRFGEMKKLINSCN